MTAYRLFVANDLMREKEIVPSESQSHYLLNVLRLSEGAGLLVFDGKNGEWSAQITSVKKRGCLLKVGEKLREQTVPQDLHYAFAPLKQARLDYMIQKAVEMGASLLQPVMTARSAVGRPNLARMRANAIEAAEQCGILSVPAIAAPVSLETLLDTGKDGRVIVFCDENAPLAPPLPALGRLEGRKLSALVGPEGGFSVEERELLLSKDFVCPISLGPRIMRADTAAVAVLALLNAVLGDWR
jgi:16S rRNA (uracil1498-N3)-methyltransferase